MSEFSICKRCGVKHHKDFMHYSIMYHGIICNNSVECLKDKQIKEDEKTRSKCGTELIQESIETYNHNQNGEPLYLPVWICPICDFGGKK